MQLTNEIVVPAPVDEVWNLLVDVERIAPCIPGFQLKEIEGDEYRGTMKVKVGAVVSEYDSSVRFLERDDVGHRAVLDGGGRELRGGGSVSATITSTLTSEGGATKVTIVTELSVVGRVAQFGRGILADVSNRLVGQFAKCLETRILSASPSA